MADKSEVRIRFGKLENEEVALLIDRIEAAATVTTGDLIYAGQRQRSRMLLRTENGIDVDGRAFAPYSTKGPIYYYPSKTAKNRRAGVRTQAAKLGLSKTKNSTTVRVPGLSGQYAQRTKLGIKFSSYAALKAAFGRKTVDLRGLKAPHMLQALIVRVNDILSGGRETIDADLNYRKDAAEEISISIFGPEAERASRHQTGDPKTNLPKRRFLGASKEDEDIMTRSIVSRMKQRIRYILDLKAT